MVLAGNLQNMNDEMAQADLLPRKRVRWGSVAFFVVMTIVTVVWCPLYIFYVGISQAEIALFVFYCVVTTLSITIGYHRLFSHLSYKASPVVQFIVLFFGAATFEQSALKWSSQHRKHHRYVDTDIDPYNIKKGFFYAHIGWLLFWKQRVNYENVKDLKGNRLLMHQHKYYQYWALTAGLITPLALGALLSGHVLGTFLIVVAARLTIVFHSTFLINSLAHSVGSANYDFESSAKDNWVASILIGGEGYHNYHHRFPSDYRNGIHWYHWDPSKWLIWVLERLGLAWDLRITPRESILEARRAVVSYRAQEALKVAPAS